MASGLPEIKWVHDLSSCGSDVKIIVVGDRRCGKTKFIETFATRVGGKCAFEEFITYSTEYRIDSVSWQVKIIEIFGVPDHLVDLETKDIYDANGIIFMYAIDDPMGFEAMPGKWMQTMEDNGSKTDQPSILVGNKKDLREDPRVIEFLSLGGKPPVTRQQGESLREDRSVEKFFETSTIDKNDPSVQEAFHFIMRSAIRHWREVHGPG